MNASSSPCGINPAYGSYKPGGSHEIPRPTVVSRRMSSSLGEDNFASQMRLNRSYADLRTYCTIVATISRLSEEHANIRTGSLGWPGFVKLVVQQMPILENYEDAWPVHAIVREHRRRRDGLMHWLSKAPSVDKHGTTHKQPTGRHVTFDPVEDAANEEPGLTEEGESASATLASVAGAPASVQTYEPEQNAQNDPVIGVLSHRRVSGTTGGSVTPQGATASSIQGDSPSYTPHAAPGRTMSSQTGPTFDPASLTPVHEFLCTLCPEQSALLPILVEKGVTDGAVLAGLARMGAKRRKKLLNSWLRESAITELQFEALDAGLEDIDVR